MLNRLIISIGFLSGLLFSQTNVNGVISTNTTWSVSSSPYIVTAPLLVNTGVTLTIEPGVQILFDESNYLWVYGQLIAQGTDENNINFTSNASSPDAGDWGQIKFFDSSYGAVSDGNGDYLSGNILKYCIIEYGSGIILDGGMPYIDNCKIRYHNNNGISGNPGSQVPFKVKNSTISNNTGRGLVISYSGTVPSASQNIIDNNTISYNSQGAIDTYPAMISNNLIDNNIMESEGAITCAGCTITDNIITNNFNNDPGGGEGGAIRLHGGTISGNIIYNNTARNGAGIFIRAGDVTITKNIIVNNSATITQVIRIDEDPSSLIFDNNIIAGHSTGVFFSDIDGPGGPDVNNPDNYSFKNNAFVDNNMINNTYDVSNIEYGIEANGQLFQNNLFFNNVNTDSDDAIIGFRDETMPAFNNNNLIGNQGIYLVKNKNSYSSTSLDAESNYWGTINEASIQSMIYDFNDEFSIGVLDIDPILTSPSTSAPISPPANVFKDLSGGTVVLTWDANPESDVAGYKIHYGEFTGYSYSENIDVGNVTTYTLSGVSINSSISVSAYDSSVDGTNDQVDGNQSWFAEAIIPSYSGPVWYVSTSGSDSNEGSSGQPLAKIQAAIDSCSNGDTVLVAAGTYTENINFNGKNIVVGSLFITTGDTSYISSTIIDGNQSGSVVTFENGETNNAILEGVSIINGYNTQGAGIYAINSSPILKHIVVRNCNAVGDRDGGGAHFSYGTGDAIIQNSTFKNNSGRKGGGLLLFESTLIENCLILNNNGDEHGSGLHFNGGSPVIKNTVIAGGTGGPAIWCGSSTPSFINSTVANNTNTNNSYGYAVWVQFPDASVSFTNSILYNPETDEVGNSLGSFPEIASITYSIVRGIDISNGNIDSNPVFIDAVNGDYRLSDHSPAIGAGTATGAPTTDLDGNPRPNPEGSNPDMGTYENALGSPSTPPQIIEIPGDYSTIQAGIEAASEGDTVLVSPGTYVENINYGGKNIVVGSLFLTTQDTSHISSTIIDGDQIESVVNFNSGESNTAILTGFTIVNGWVSPMNELEFGGGVRIHSSSPKLSNLVIVNNGAVLGGGIGCENSQAIITDCRIENNNSIINGGGLFLRDSDLMISDVSILENTAGESTGTGGGGGGLYCLGSDPTLTRVLFAYNDSPFDYGGAIYCDSSNPNLTNVTITNNTAMYPAGGIFCNNGAEATLINCILWNNSENQINTFIDGSATVSYSNIQYGYEGEGNINADPLFCGVEGNDYALAENSPCVSTGQDGTNMGALGVECSSIDPPILDWTNSGFENGFIDWDIWPSDINADVVEEFYYEGSKSLKIIPYTGDGYYARVGKEFNEADAENLAGRTIFLEAQFFTSSGDVYWLGGDSLRFVAMYFDQGWAEIRFDYSENFDLNVDNWNYKSLITTVPSNARNIAFGINATGSESVGSIYVDNFTATLIDPGPPTINYEIFFSEYGEGSSNNKYLEIYNGSGETINLDDYVLLGNINGNPWSETFTFAAGATLESGDLYVIAQAEASEAIVDLADETWVYGDGTHQSGEPVYIVNFNGDDVRALAFAIDPQNNIIDIIGTLDEDGDGTSGEGSEDDPGQGFDVAGVSEATKDHTLVRKAHIAEGNSGDWASSAGTNENNSEWIVYEQDYWESLGWHSSYGSNLSVKDGLGYDIDWTNISNELSANWLSILNDDAVSFEYAIGIFPVPSTEIVSWTSTGTDTFFTHTGLSLVEGATYYSHIRRVNSTSQPIDTVSSNGVTIDLTAPVMHAIYEGGLSEDMDFQQSTDYLTLAWSGIDDTSGIDQYEYAWGTSAGADDIVTWSATNEQSAGDTVLSLQDGSMYFGSVRGTDAAGNQSTTLTGNGLTIDASQPIGGMVIDGDSIDIDFTSSTTTLTASWSGFTDAGSGISEYHYAIGTEPGETQNVNWVSVGTDSLVTNSALTLISGITYYVSVKATDSVGNEGDTVSTNGITIDTQPPSTGNVNDGTQQDLEFTSSTNTLSGNWTGFNDALSGIAFYEYAIDTISGGTDLVSWTNTGLDSNFTEDELNLQNDQEYFISVRATDALGNVCEAVSSDGITVDWEFPTIAYIYEGNTDSDNDSQSDNQNLILAWGLDNSAVTISSYEYSVGTEPGTIDILGWTDNDTDTMVTITGLSLEYGLTYYGSVRAYNADGFSSGIYTGDGITIVDMVPPISGMVIDGSGEDIDYVNSTGNVEASWSGFIDEESGIESYEYALGSDASLIDIIDFTPVGLEQNILLTGLSLANGSHYQFSVRAIDMVGNVSDTATSDGFVVDSIMGPPQITNLSVDTLSIVNATTDTQIEIEFSEPLQSHNVELAASIQSGYTVASVYSEDPPKLNVTLQAPFASMDTLILIIDNLIDLAGVEADPKELTYYSGLLADYNSDLNVDIIDLAQFIQAWNNGDYTYELGPVTGAVPHLIPAPDSLFTIRDAMTFSRMWYWSNSSAMNTMAMRSAMGAPIEVNQSGRKIIIKLPDESIASEIAIEYPIENMEFSYQSETNKENDIMLSKKFAEEQVFMQLNGFIKSSDISIGREIMFDISGSPDHEIELVINYRIMGSESETIGEGSHQLNYLPMPDEFSLYQNYPNPFNPVTQIKYDLPEASHIQLLIYDILGREVRSLVNEVQEPGYKSIIWHGTDTFGRNVGAGMYFYSIQAGDFRQVKKMVYLK